MSFSWRALLAACGGFLLAVLWFDLMFDVQVLAYAGAELVPDAVLASIAAYYRRVTTEAFPMNRLIAAVMLVAVGGSFYLVLRRRAPLWSGLAGLVLVTLPVVLAATRVFPAAARLATRVDSPAVQSELARAICRDHLFCFASIAVFVTLQIAGPVESTKV